jgi:hypothetical protein
MWWWVHMHSFWILYSHWHYLMVWTREPAIQANVPNILVLPHFIKCCISLEILCEADFCCCCCSAEDPTQGIAHARQALHYWAILAPLPSSSWFLSEKTLANHTKAHNNTEKEKAGSFKFLEMVRLGNYLAFSILVKDCIAHGQNHEH